MDDLKMSNMNDKCGIYISQQYFKRVQLYIKGYVHNVSLEQLEFRLMNMETKKYVSPQSVQVVGENFECRFNIITADDGNYISPGKYQLVALSKEIIVAQYQSDFFKNNVEDYNKTFYNSGKNKVEYYTLKLQQNTSSLYELNVDLMVESRELGKSQSFNKIGDKLDRVREIFFKIIFNISKNLRFKRRKLVLFTSDSRATLTGNMKYIYDKMKELDLDKRYIIKFSFKKHISSRRKLLDKIKFPILLGKADWIIVDDYHPLLYKVKFAEHQEIVQLWHACGTLKTVGFSRLGKNGGPFIDSEIHKIYTRSYVSSDKEIMYYSEAFGIKEINIIPTGVPRTDMFFNREYVENTRENLKSKHTYMQNKKIILFAPTFRGKGHRTAYYPKEKIELDALAKYCKDNNAIILFKMHPFVREKIKIPKEYEQYLKDFSNYREVNDLLCITDILITDYSSLIFEYAILKGKMLFYAFDLENYIKQRDFYIDYETFMPGKIVKSFDALIDALTNEDFEDEKVKEFYEEHFKYRDGRSSERVVKHLFQV